MTLTVASMPDGTGSAETRGVCRVVLIDRHRIFRQALGALIGTEEGFAVVGDAGDWLEALSLIERLRPDLVVTELHLSEESGAQHLAEIHRRFPQMNILVLTASRAHGVAAQVKRAGALGYLLKDQGRSELRVALREVVAGRVYRSSVPAVRSARTPPPEGTLSSRALYLTERQRQVLHSLARGYRTQQIAQMLGVSVRAVHKQRERLRHALQLNNTAALTRFALREGLAEQEQESG